MVKMHVKSKIVIPLLFLMLLISGCRDEFMPKINDYDNVLVVDGMITNEAGPYTIKLSRTSDVNKPDYQPLTGCEVTVTDDSGNPEQFAEEAPGVYKSATEGMTAQTGSSYKLSVVTPDGSQYESEFIEMKPAIGIDSIQAGIEYQETTEHPAPVGGYRFSITTSEAEEDIHLLWRLSETYEYTSDFMIDYIYRGMGVEEFTNSDTLYRCWKTQDVDDFFVASSSPLTENRITNQPLHFVNSTTKKLQVRYSLLTKQYNISADAYAFWRDIREQISGDDFLFSAQPFQLQGNVRNIESASEVVFGYFTVAAVTEKRIFVDRPDILFYHTQCIPDPDLRALGFMGPDQFPVYLTNSSEGIALGSEYCFDCTLWGGQLSKPVFWEEKKSDKN